MTLDERLDVLADVLAECFLYLGEKGLLEEVAHCCDGGGPKEFARRGTESPCFPSDDRLSFSHDSGVERELNDPE